LRDDVPARRAQLEAHLPQQALRRHPVDGDHRRVGLGRCGRRFAPEHRATRPQSGPAQHHAAQPALRHHRARPEIDAVPARRFGARRRPPPAAPATPPSRPSARNAPGPSSPTTSSAASSKATSTPAAKRQRAPPRRAAHHHPRPRPAPDTAPPPRATARRRAPPAAAPGRAHRPAPPAPPRPTSAAPATKPPRRRRPPPRPPSPTWRRAGPAHPPTRRGPPPRARARSPTIARPRRCAATTPRPCRRANAAGSPRAGSARPAPSTVTPRERALRRRALREAEPGPATALDRPPRGPPRGRGRWADRPRRPPARVPSRRTTRAIALAHLDAGAGLNLHHAARHHLQAEGHAMRRVLGPPSLAPPNGVGVRVAARPGGGHSVAGRAAPGTAVGALPHAVLACVCHGVGLRRSVCHPPRGSTVTAGEGRQGKTDTAKISERGHRGNDTRHGGAPRWALLPRDEAEKVTPSWRAEPHPAWAPS
jgi:hypothetical protein